MPIKILLLLCMFALITGCGKDNENATAQHETKVDAEVVSKPIQQHTLALDSIFFSLFDSQLKQASTAAQQLLASTKSFTNNPNPESLDQALIAWQRAHNAYHALNIIQHSMISTPAYPEESTELVQHSLASRLDKADLLPGYLDSVSGYPFSGIIHSETELTERNLIIEHQLSDSAYVAMGFHALEFMLQGDPELNYSPEHRFLTKENDEDRHNAAVARRISYVTLLAELILKDIKQIESHWTTNGPINQQLDELSQLAKTEHLLTMIETEIADLNKAQPDTHMSADALSLRRQFIAGITRSISENNPKTEGRISNLKKALIKAE